MLDLLKQIKQPRCTVCGAVHEYRPNSRLKVCSDSCRQKKLRRDFYHALRHLQSVHSHDQEVRDFLDAMAYQYRLTSLFTEEHDD